MARCGEPRLSHRFSQAVDLIWQSPVELMCCAPWMRLELLLPFPAETAEQREAVLPLVAARIADLPLVVVSVERTTFEPPAPPALSRPIADLVALRDNTLGTRRKASDLSLELTQIVDSCSLKTGEVHAVAAFSHIRDIAFRSRHKSHNGVLESSLRALSRTEAIRLSIEVLQQSYYVTSHGVACLSAALGNDNSSRFVTELDRYIKQEEGHERLVLRALDALGSTNLLTRVHRSTRSAMAILKWAAEHNAFALASCIALFEMGGYAQYDPLAEVLHQLGEHEAARAVEAHFRINQRERHAEIGMLLCAQLGSVAVRDLDTALQCVSTLCDFFDDIEATYARRGARQ